MAEARQVQGELVLLVLSGDMEKGLAACNLAIAALAADRPVTLFFSFWGLNFLKERKGRADGTPLSRLFGWINRDHAASQRLGRFHLGGAGRWALLRLMRRHRIPPFRESLEMAHQMGARVIACSATLSLMGLGRDDLIPEVDEIAGAMAFLDRARGGQAICIS
ncbi:MAG: DsrE/DsrF/DrsH-like family protein [Acidobacteriota bacterium]